MAEALCVRMGCICAQSSRNKEATPLCYSSCDRHLREALSFQKSVSNRLPLLPRLQTSYHPHQVSVQVNAVVGYPASMAWWKKGNEPNMREINSAQEFVEAIAQAGDKLVLVDFYSVGCRSCKAVHPKICQIAADNPDIDVLKVNFYDNNALCRSLKVSILPFFQFYQGKEGLVDAFSCSLTKVSDSCIHEDKFEREEDAKRKRDKVCV
eukprot:c18032_g1_i1 orf=574-1200(+)